MTRERQHRVARRERESRRTPAFAIIALSLAACTASRAVPPAERASGGGAPSASSLDSVRVDGRLVRTRLLGASGPSVVLISGLGDRMTTWDSVQPAVATFARVLAYDRAGIGRSEPGPAPRTVSRMADELHALLPHTGLDAPYVIVGHSLGGFVAQLYAARYPGDVAGIVLVDPSLPGFYIRAESLPEWKDASGAQAGAMASASAGVRAENDAFDEDVIEVRDAPPLPAVPTVLLTSTHHGPPSDRPSALEALWLDEQRRWASGHPGTRQVVDSIHGHSLQREAPALVIDAIRSVIAGRR
jgi:pimeloyl-ACP methyl ester carboxylesterase